MGKTIIIPFSEIDTPEKATRTTIRKISEAMGEAKAVHRREVKRIHDDHARKVRVIEMEDVKTYVST